MTGPDCAVMCNPVNTNTHTREQERRRTESSSGDGNGNGDGDGDADGNGNGNGDGDGIENEIGTEEEMGKKRKNRTIVADARQETRETWA